jgi:hypothetical protein
MLAAFMSMPCACLLALLQTPAAPLAKRAMVLPEVRGVCVSCTSNPTWPTACFCAQVDIVVTVSGFSAVPSLSTGIASRFGMRSDVECFSLSGHGCPGGLVGVGCVEQLLLVRGLQGPVADVGTGGRACGCRSRTRARR